MEIVSNLVRKCLATGKVTFQTKTEARLTMLNLRWGVRAIRNRLNGKRVKHRQGKPLQQRIYLCPHCGGFHLTKWRRKDFLDYVKMK